MPFHKICGPVVAPTTSTHYIELHYSCETFVCNELDLRARVIIGTTFSISLILNSRLILRITVEFFGSRASPLIRVCKNLKNSETRPDPNFRVSLGHGTRNLKFY